MHSIFSESVVKMNFFREKKYGTFGWGVCVGGWGRGRGLYIQFIDFKIHNAWLDKIL